MKRQIYIIGIMAITSCSPQKDVWLNNNTENPDLPNQEAIEWIENHLTPSESLKNHISRKSILEAMSEYKIPGVSMAFVDQGEIAWTKTYGYADLQTLEKVTKDTVFTGASFSKPLTAIAALDLVENNKLNLDENVNNKLEGWHIPENEFTENEKVTLRHLLSHRAGVKNDLWSSYLPEQTVPSLTQMLAGQPPSVDPAVSVIATPGSAEQYSNPGYSIIQKLIEDVTDQSFEKVLDELVLEVSGMSDSSFQQPIPDYLQTRRATGYDENLNPFPYRLFPYKAAGGIWTTPSDMARFIITLYKDYEGHNKILSSSAMAKVFSRDPIRLAFAKIYDENSEDLLFRHYGTNQGFSSYLVGSIHKHQAVVIMTNGHMEFEFLDYVARAVAEFYDWDYLKPTIHLPYITTALELDDYIGHFRIDDKQLEFSIQNDMLAVKLKTENEPENLTQISPGEFISIKDSAKYQFLKAREASDGTFIWVRVTSPGGSESYAERVKTNNSADN